MTRGISILCALLLLIGAPCYGSGGGGAAPSPEQIDSWIRALGSSKFKRREEATRELESLGADVEDELGRALKETNDPEIRARLEGLLKRIDPRVSIEKLTPAAKSIALRSFRTSVTGKGNRLASIKSYCEDQFGICDVGSIRIAVKGHVFRGGSDGL